VVDVRLEAELVLNGYGECDHKVHSGSGRHVSMPTTLQSFHSDLLSSSPEYFLQFTKQVVLGRLRPLNGVHPDDTTERLRRENELTPVSPALGISLIGRRAAERQTHTDHETGDGQQHGLDRQLNVVELLGQNCDQRCPSANNDERHDQLRGDAAMKLQE
jgi:hypothetical protein